MTSNEDDMNNITFHAINFRTQEGIAFRVENAILTLAWVRAFVLKGEK